MKVHWTQNAIDHLVNIYEIDVLAVIHGAQLLSDTVVQTERDFH